MRKEKESNRAIYQRTWYAWNFLSENDHMAVFDGKIVWLMGFITVSSIVLFLGMVLWNTLEPEHQIDGVYVLAASAGLAFLVFIAYLIYITSHNHEVTQSKATLAETRTLHPKVWSVIQGHSEYSLIPDEIAKLDKLAKFEEQDDEEVNDEQDAPKEEPGPTKQVFALPEDAGGLDYDELIKDETVAKYLEVGNTATNFDELIEGWRRIEGR